MLDGALAHVERSGEKADLAEMLRLKGEIMLMRDPPQPRKPSDAFATSLEARARTVGEMVGTANRRPASRDLLRKAGKRDEARAMLAEIYNWFTEGFDTADLKDAKALQEELSG